MSEVLGMEQRGGWLSEVFSELHASGLPLSAHSNGYANLLRVKPGPGMLFGFSVFSSLGASQWIQVFDSQKAPANGDTPAAIFTIATIGNLGVSYIFPGRFHRYGIWIANSTTGPTYTAGAADSFFDAQFV